MFIRRNRDRRGRRRLGAAAVETAAVLPFLITLILGQIEMCRLGMVAQLLTNTAREAARVAVINGSSVDDVKTRIQTALSGSGINYADVTVGLSMNGGTTVTDLSSAPDRTPITVSLSVPYGKVSWLPTPVYLSETTVRATATLNSERP